MLSTLLRNATILCIFATITTSLQAQTIRGKVLNKETNEPIVGANILVTGTNKGTVTDTDGEFAISVPQEAETLRISYVGYETRQTVFEDNMTIYLQPSLRLEEILIRGVRAEKDDPVAQSTIHKKELKSVYNGEQPAFYLEDLTPAVTSTSESGTKLANYGSMRLRGLDQMRINMTLNGVPLNDMIAQNVVFSNFTDISGSFESVQVQRGVGTSSSGTASYAGSINFESVNLEGREQGGQLELGAGSYNSYRFNADISSGMIDDHWSFYGAFSRITSDGYRYHTNTDARSFFFSGGYFGENDMIKVNAFDAGSKNGLGYSVVAESDLEADPQTNYLNENDKDDFGQKLVQLQYTHKFNDRFSTNTSLYYSGAGGDFLVTLPETDSTLSQINYPLYNDHYGFKINGFWNTDHWEISSGVHGYLFTRTNEESNTPDFEHPYYKETSDKKEISWFAKAEWTRNDWKLFADIQIRTQKLTINPDYDFMGIAPEGPIEKHGTFVNPKLGLSYSINKNIIGYASAGRMGREPTRVDILGGVQLGPNNYEQARADNFNSEYVNDYEVGLRFDYSNLAFNANYYFMDFQDMIAPIGEVLPFGKQKRRNISSSYRTGIELQWNYLPMDFLTFQGNMAYMRSHIGEFTTGAGDTYTDKTPILSPEWIINGNLKFFPLSHLSVSLSAKFVSDSYLELTNDPDMMLPEYSVFDASVGYEFNKVSLRLEASNLGGNIYYSDGAPVDTNGDGTFDEPGFLINAGRHFFFSVNYKL